MENASKALIIAAEVLLGMMIIAVAVALFNTLSGFSQTTIEEMEKKKLSEFNSNFSKYYGEIDGKPIEVTIHDIISVAYFAKQNNLDNELQNESGYNENTNYVQVDLRIGNKNITKLETRTEAEYNELIQENSLIADNVGKQTQTKIFVCTTVVYSKVSGRVIYVSFSDKV